MLIYRIYRSIMTSSWFLLPSLPSAHWMHKYVYTVKPALAFALATVAVTWWQWTVIARFCQSIRIRIENAASQIVDFSMFFFVFVFCFCFFLFILSLLYKAAGVVNHVLTHSHARTLILTVWWSNLSNFISKYSPIMKENCFFHRWIGRMDTAHNSTHGYVN